MPLSLLSAPRRRHRRCWLEDAGVIVVGCRMPVSSSLAAGCQCRHCWLEDAVSSSFAAECQCRRCWLQDAVVIVVIVALSLSSASALSLRCRFHYHHVILLSSSAASQRLACLVNCLRDRENSTVHSPTRPLDIFMFMYIANILRGLRENVATWQGGRGLVRSDSRIEVWRARANVVANW
jgi:hypothetical protein